MRGRGLGDLVINVGMIGVSEGNGHPYSYSAIINGYDKDLMRESGWRPIYDYLSKRRDDEFGVDGLRITHVWTQDPGETGRIAAASRIDSKCGEYEEMIGRVDAVIIARDDWRAHIDLARPFLEHGTPVFLDKPLSLDVGQLRYFRKYLESGTLMSCAAMRYAEELDEYRRIRARAKLKYIHGSVIGDWERYGVHMLDGIFSCNPVTVRSVHAFGGEALTTVLQCDDETRIVVSCLGKCPKTFNIAAFSETEKWSFEFSDNFSAFKRMLNGFRDMLVHKVIPIDPEHTINIMRILMACNLSLNRNASVYLDEIRI